MHEETYHKLAQHLDRLPGGFGSQDEAIDLRLLRMLFTPQEAELATHLSLDRESAAAIGARAGLFAGEVEERLADMARRGLIMPAYRDEGPTLYQAMPFVVGIYEFQIDRQDDEWLQAVCDYFGNRRRKPAAGPPQVRTIPIGQSPDACLEVLPYEQVDALVAAHNRFAVAPCICRRTARLCGGGCDAPEESCLSFGDWAVAIARSGRGRAIDRDEVMAILARADAANLVLQPSNSKEISFLCTCCSCCCGVLADIKRQPKPAEAVVNAFIARYEPERCEDCGTCLERCQMEALAQGDGRIELNTERCIGCGLCASTCPSSALTLARKPPSEHLVPPDTLRETWRRIARAQEEAG